MNDDFQQINGNPTDQNLLNQQTAPQDTFQVKPPKRNNKSLYVVTSVFFVLLIATTMGFLFVKKSKTTAVNNNTVPSKKECPSGNWADNSIKIDSINDLKNCQTTFDDNFLADSIYKNSLYNFKFPQPVETRAEDTYKAFYTRSEDSSVPALEFYIKDWNAPVASFYSSTGTNIGMEKLKIEAEKGVNDLIKEHKKRLDTEFGKDGEITVSEKDLGDYKTLYILEKPKMMREGDEVVPAIYLVVAKSYYLKGGTAKASAATFSLVVMDVPVRTYNKEKSNYEKFMTEVSKTIKERKDIERLISVGF